MVYGIFGSILLIAALTSTFIFANVKAQYKDVETAASESWED
ncbi:MAG: hypothetical protein PF447_04265 [Spirochaetaceae bacterium]|nr:hypothetical protein [Spirochaetaceae bacterium]